MKLAVLRSIGHNIADSLASGIGLMIGVYTTDIFLEAQGESNGRIEVDFLFGVTNSPGASDSLRGAIRLYSEALPDLCKKHGVNCEGIASLTARFAVDRVYGPHFTVSGATLSGRTFTDQYVGIPGRKYRSSRNPGRPLASPERAA